MLALLAAALFAQTSATVRIGDAPKVDSAKADSIAHRRDVVRDSIRRHAGHRDSVRTAARIARRPALTPALIASAFKDTRARDLLTKAREARLKQDSTLTSYDAKTYERISVGMGFKRIGRDRLLMRAESASDVKWQRGKPAMITVTGQRSVFPSMDGMGDGEIDLDTESDIPYVPGRETLWIGGGLAKADVSENEIIHPLAAGAEAFYTYAAGDSVSFQLPGGGRIELRELKIRPRQQKWNVAVGSLWFDTSSGQLVRAVYRMAQEMNMLEVAKEVDGEDPKDEIPRWVRPMILPLKAKVSAVTVEYGLHEARFWLPRSQTVEGDANVSFMWVTFKLEQRYKYGSVNGTDPFPELTVAVGDTATDSSLARPGASVARTNARPAASA